MSIKKKCHIFFYLTIIYLLNYNFITNDYYCKINFIIFLKWTFLVKLHLTKKLYYNFEINLILIINIDDLKKYYINLIQLTFD